MVGKNLPSVRVGGFNTVVADRSELAAAMVEDCLRARDEQDAWLPRLVFSSNGQGIALAMTDAGFRGAMGAADVIHADGMPVVMASRLTSTPIKQRSATTDFFHDAAAAAESSGLRFFILGAKEEQNFAAVEAMKSMYPGLIIAGRHHGYFDQSDDERICSLIRESKADVLWLALGKPRQEYWAVRNRGNLRGVGWVKTCGGLYAFLAGDVPRAPRWMQSLGLEWLFRLRDDPLRLAGRYLWTNPIAAFALLTRTGSAGRRE